ncbi:unnamed protein product [Prorocentrum cordatum]|uniref:Uncharacterized protein n=1 Tax=Prorocentrum cordatum TaxID=2364126 RepID=A0ABN9UI01_9DINO|nr:unnamed protein product [Polarella glacialis]
MSLQGSLAPVAAKLPNGLTSKNTFLDHPSPWIDYVTVGDRPKSDPTSDATSSSTAEVSAVAPADSEPFGISDAAAKALESLRERGAGREERPLDRGALRGQEERGRERRLPAVASWIRELRGIREGW